MQIWDPESKKITILKLKFSWVIENLPSLRVPLVEHFALLDLVLTVFIVSHDYSSLHIWHCLELVFACVSYLHVLIMCAHALYHICLINTDKKKAKVFVYCLIKTKFSLFFQIIFSFGAQPLVLSKLVPHLCILFGDSNSQVKFYLHLSVD